MSLYYRKGISKSFPNYVSVGSFFSHAFVQFAAQMLNLGKYLPEEQSLTSHSCHAITKEIKNKWWSERVQKEQN